MESHYHAIVWIDHHEAKIFHFNATDVDGTTIRSSDPHQHLHHKANTRDSGHAPVEQEFLKHVADAVAHAGAVLITGPANAKKELAAYIERERPDLAKRGFQASKPCIMKPPWCLGRVRPNILQGR